MNQRRITLYLLLALVIFTWAYVKIGEWGDQRQVGSSETVLAEMQSQPLYYTRHAKCRMQCRKIDQDEVEEILETGRINWQKSEVNDQPCATYAIEGRTRDHQNVRIVYANCSRETKVVTTIDLDRHYDCVCD